jgi:hypothetical protein
LEANMYTVLIEFVGTGGKDACESTYLDSLRFSV